MHLQQLPGFFDSFHSWNWPQRGQVGADWVKGDQRWEGKKAGLCQTPSITFVSSNLGIFVLNGCRILRFPFWRARSQRVDPEQQAIASSNRTGGRGDLTFGASCPKPGLIGPAAIVLCFQLLSSTIHLGRLPCQRTSKSARPITHGLSTNPPLTKTLDFGLITTYCASIEVARLRPSFTHQRMPQIIVIWNWLTLP